MAGALRPDVHPSTDIATSDDVTRLVRCFYQAAIPDSLLGPAFDAAGIDWSVHIPLLRSYWERELLDVPGYAGNVVSHHRRMLELITIGPPHLERWVELFDETVDELFVGPTADVAKRRAREVALALGRLAARHERSTP